MSLSSSPLSTSLSTSLSSSSSAPRTMTSSSSSSTISFVWSYMNLLSGGLEDCQHADDETCSAGITSVHAFLRKYSNSNENENEPSLVISRIDYQSVFVNMHPLNWGVNRLILRDRFQQDVFFAYRSLLVSSQDDTKIQQRDLSTLQTKELQVLLGNIVVATSNLWSQYTKNIHFDANTGLAVIVIDNGQAAAGDTQSLGSLNSVAQVQAVKGLLSFVAQENQAKAGCSDVQDAYSIYLQRTRQYNNGTTTNDSSVQEEEETSKCWIPIVVYDETREEYFQSFLDGILSETTTPAEPNNSNGYTRPYQPPAVIAQVRSYGLQFSTPQQIDDTWIVSYRTQSRNLVQLRLELADYNNQEEQGNSSSSNAVFLDKRKRITNITLIEEDLSTIPNEIKDEQFREDIAYLRTLADEAMENNPILGPSLAMPPAKFPQDIQYSPCMGGECPIGNLFTDALRWWTNADFAFVNSGGIRGPGWPEGDVRVGNIWEALPFANTQCTGMISGINLFRIFRESTTAATFLGTWTSTGDRLFQVSGIRYTYNTELEAPRLIALEIWDENLQEYKPVERLQLYKFATSSWMCSGFDPFPSMLTDELTVEGEERAIIGDTLLQNIVGHFLGHLEEPYDTSIQGRLVNDTSALEPLDLIQTEDSCNSSTYWVENYLTCFDCPNTDEVKVTGPTALFDTESGSDEILSSTAEIVNGEAFPVTVVLKSKPDWLSFPSDADLWKDGDGEKITIDPGEAYSFEYDVSAANLSPGLVSAPISFAVLDGGNYPGCVGRDALYPVSLKIANQPEFSQPGSIMIVGFTLMSAILLLSISLALWVQQNKKKREVSSMQPNFLVALCFGVSTIGLSILPLSIRSLDISPRGQNMACMATPWLLSTGFAVVMSTLISKLWRINKLFSGRRFQRIKLTSREVFVAFVTILSTNVLLMLLWTLIDPLEFDIRFIEDETWKLYSTCTSQNGTSWIFLLLTIGINFLAMSFAIYEAYKARNISDDYSESKSLGIAIFSWIQILIVGCPVLFLIEDDSVAPKYFLQVALIFVSCISMLLIIFIPLIAKTRARPSSARNRSTLRISGLNFSWFSEGGLSYALSGRNVKEAHPTHQIAPSRGNKSKNSSSDPISSMPTHSHDLSHEIMSHTSGGNNSNTARTSSSSERQGEQQKQQRDPAPGGVGRGSAGSSNKKQEELSTVMLADHEAACTARLSMVEDSEITVNA